jgi:hypothetical protein
MLSSQRFIKNKERGFVQNRTVLFSYEHQQKTVFPNMNS